MDGKVPNSIPLQLHSIVFNSIPDMDGSGSCNPLIEIYQMGRLVFSTRNFDLNGKNMILRDPYNIIFRTVQPVANAGEQQEGDDISVATSHPALNESAAVPLLLAKDVEIRFYNQKTYVVDTSATATTSSTIADMPMQLMFTFTFNTCFVSSGLTRIRRGELELATPGVWQSQKSDDRIPKDFSIDLILSNHAGDFAPITYSKVMDKNLAKCLAKLSQFHYVKADPTLLKALEIQHYKKLVGKCSIYLPGG